LRGHVSGASQEAIFEKTYEYVLHRRSILAPGLEQYLGSHCADGKERQAEQGWYEFVEHFMGGEPCATAFSSSPCWPGLKSVGARFFVRHSRTVLRNPQGRAVPIMPIVTVAYDAAGEGVSALSWDRAAASDVWFSDASFSQPSFRVLPVSS
jgi:hypothetical protein